MRRAAPVVLVGALLSGCAGRPCRPCPPCPPGVARDAAAWTGAPPTVPLPPRPARVAPARAATPAPPTPSDRLAEVAKAPDPASALLALAREAPEVLRDAPDDAFAPLLSDRVRLVDLRDVARDGGDSRPYAPGPLGGGLEEPGDGVDPRVHRIAQGVRDALGANAWEEGQALLVVRRWGLVIVQAPERWIDVEKALDRFAVAGGPASRIAVLVSDDAGALAKAVGIEGGRWERTDAARVPDVPGLTESFTHAVGAPDVVFPSRREEKAPSLTAPPEPVPAGLESWGIGVLEDAVWARAEAVAAVPALRVPISGDRRVAAGRTSRTTYVRDIASGAAGDVPVPIVAALVDGTTLRGWRQGDRWRADLVRAQVVHPIDVFESRINSNGPALRVELPELRVARLGADLAPAVGSAVLVRTSGGVPIACLFRVEAHEEGVPTHAAWRWWKAPSTTRFGSGRAYGWPVSVAIERLASEGSESSVVAAPRLLLTEGDEGIVTLQEEEAFVVGAEARAPGRRDIADPVVGILVTGIAIRAQARPQSEGSVVVEGLLRVDDRDRPMRSFRAVGSSPAPAASLSRALTVQLPRTWRTDIPFRVRMRPGESVDVPAAARTAQGPETLRLRLTLGEPVRLFTPWPREDPRR